MKNLRTSTTLFTKLPQGTFFVISKTPGTLFFNRFLCTGESEKRRSDESKRDLKKLPLTHVLAIKLIKPDGDIPTLRKITTGLGFTGISIPTSGVVSALLSTDIGFTDIFTHLPMLPVIGLAKMLGESPLIWGSALVFSAYLLGNYVACKASAKILKSNDHPSTAVAVEVTNFFLCSYIPVFFSILRFIQLVKGLHKIEDTKK